MNAKHASTTLTLVEAPTETACPAWCLRHEPLVEDLCIGPVIELDFGDPGLDFTSHARIQTYSEPAGGVDLTLSLTNNVNGTHGYPLTPQQARQIGAALIQAAEATDGGAR